MRYELEFVSSASKELKKLSPDIQDKIFEKIDELLENPRPYGYEQLTNFSLPNLKEKPVYRVRVGDYRIVYVIKEDKILVKIAKIAHRREVYK
jgi:mRNA interferase RelE/StbE